MIDLTVKTLDSKNHAFSVPDDITVKQLKEWIADSVNIPAESQRLIYCGRVLQDDKSLSEYDVNGKVIHLVQRAPPISNGSGPDRTSTTRSSTGTSGNRRTQQWRTLFGPGGNSGNAMYVGAMAFPAEIMDASGVSLQQPRQCFSESRLIVARSMLRRASVVLNRLENPPQESTETSPENGSGASDLNGEEETATTSVPIAAVEITPGSFVIDNQTIEVRGPTVEVQTEATGEQNSAANEPQAEQPQSASTSQQQSPQNGNEEGDSSSRSPRTRALADLMDQAADINNRVQPFMTQYHQLLRDDPVFSNQEAVATNQRLFNGVSEIMHHLAHAYHALSDIMCDFSQAPPRVLRCRPVLIHHSAVVQTGIPIQVSANLGAAATTASNTQQSSTNGTTRTSAGGNRQTAADSIPEESASGAQSTTSAGQSTSEEQSTSQQPQAQSQGTSTTPSVSPPRVSRIGQVGSGGPGFEFFVDVAPGSITIDSVEAHVVTNAPPNTSEANSWQNPPEFVQNLISALAGHMGATLQQYQVQPTPVSSSSSSAQTTSSTQTASGQPPAAQNSQARGNTATHPTTATQTRSTARPHVHLSPSIHGLRANSIDPFLPCNSHHIRSSTARSRQRAGQPSNNTNASGANDAPRVITVPASNSISINLRAEPLLNAEQSASRVSSGQRPSSTPNLPPEMQTLLQALQPPNVREIEFTSPASLAQLLENVPGYSYTPGESIFTDVFMTLAQSLSFLDMVQLGLGNSECLMRARPQLRQLISQRLLNNEPLTISAITQIIDRFNNELRPYYSIFDNARLREEVDLPATINLYNHSMLPSILNTVMEEDQSTFHRTLMRKSSLYVRQLCAILLYCCLEGVSGLESILRSFVNQMTTGVPGFLQDWTVTNSVLNFRSFVNSLNVPSEDIKRFLVYRIGNPDASPQPATTPPHVPPAAEPMDVQEMEEIEVESTPNLMPEPPIADIPPTQHINEVVGWQSALPSDWVPIITRDSQRQRRQNSQGPFSDAYLSGMPSKRRKLITNAKPQGNLSQVISESMSTALGAAGMSSGPEVDVIAQRAGQDRTLRTAYREQVRVTLGHNLTSNPDYTPEKYPNSAKYYKQQ